MTLDQPRPPWAGNDQMPLTHVPDLCGWTVFEGFGFPPRFADALPFLAFFFPLELELFTPMLSEDAFSSSFDSSSNSGPELS